MARNEAFVYLIVDDLFASSGNEHRHILLAFLNSLDLLDFIATLPLDEVGEGTRHVIDVDNVFTHFFVEKHWGYDLCVHPPYLFVFGFVFLDRGGLEVLVRVPHLPKVTGNYGP